MSTTIRRTRVTRGAVLTAAAALAACVLPAVSASAADPTPPAFGYLRMTGAGDVSLLSNDAVGTPAAATTLTPTGYQVYGYDMAQDGKTWVATMCHGTYTVSECAGSPADKAYSYDMTYALVLVHNDGVSTTSRVLSTFWDANPVITADGASVYWLVNDKIYKYTVSTGAVGYVSSGQFVTARSSSGAALETPRRLAISPGGTSAAVLYVNANPVLARVRASAMSNAKAKPAYFQKSYTVKTLAPSDSSFVFTAEKTLLYVEANNTAVVADPVNGVPVPLQQVTAALPASLANTSTTVPLTALKDTYDVRAFGSSFYNWADHPDSVDTAKAVSAFGLTTDPAVAPASRTDRSDGDTTSRYVPTAVTPNALVAPTNPAAAHPALIFAARSVLSGRKVAYAALNYYVQYPAPTTYNASTAAEVDRGVLSWSTDNWATRQSVTTTGANAFLVGSTWYYGITPRLTRNTQFRWAYAGDLFTAPGYTNKFLVTVVPLVTVRQSASGASRTVYGTTTRIGGTATLYRVVGSKLVKVVSTRITSKGAYSFGKRRLARGTYKVVTAPDTGWASGAAAIRF